MATEDDAKITRRDFLKFASLAFGGLAFAPLLRTKESVSNSNFEPYTSMLGTNGLTMVLDKNTKTLSLFEGQPDKMEINGIQLIQVTGQPKALVENFPLILSPEQPTKRAGVRKFSYQIEDVLIYSSLLANGTLGTKKYEEEKAKKQILIDANPNKFTSLDTNGNIVSGLYGKVTIEIGRNWDDSPRYGSVKVVSNDNTISRFFRMYPASPQITQPDEKFAESTGKGTYLIRAIPTARTTPEAPEPSVPDLGDPRYGQAIKALGPDRVQITEDQVLVDWEGTGNFVPAFWKDKNGNWKKRFLLRADGAENITAQGLRYSKLDNKQNSTHVGIVFSHQNIGFVDAILNGNLWEIDNPNGKEGKVIVSEALTQRGGVEELIAVTIAYDIGDGIDVSVPGGKKIGNVFDYSLKFKQGNQRYFQFRIKEDSSYEKYPVYIYNKPDIPANKEFVEGGRAPDILFTTGTGKL